VFPETLDSPVISSPKHFGPTKRVFNPSIEDKGKKITEEFVPKNIQEAHGFLLHGVNQAGAIDELSPARGDGFVEIGQFFGQNRQVRVENHEDISLGRIESHPDIFRFANSGASDETYSLFGYFRAMSLTFSAVAVRRLIIAKD